MSLNFFTMDFLEENLCDLMAEATETKNSIVLDKRCDILIAIANTLYLAGLITQEEHEALITFAVDIYCHVIKQLIKPPGRPNRPVNE